MKKTTLFSLLTIVLLFTGCQAREVQNEYHITIDGYDAVLSYPDSTRAEAVITTDHGTYTVSYTGHSSLEIIYPNGYVYSERDMGGAVASSWPYEETPADLGYINGNRFRSALSSAGKSNTRTKAVPIPVSLLMMAVGIWMICRPKTAWMLSHGWRYKNAEPSDLALASHGLAGIAIVFFGFMSLFS